MAAWDSYKHTRSRLKCKYAIEHTLLDSSKQAACPHTHDPRQLGVLIRKYQAIISTVKRHMVLHAAHTFLPVVKGRYLYLIMCFIWRFIVMKNSTNQYSSRMGQKTGTSKMGKNVKTKPRANAFADEYLHAQSCFVTRSAFGHWQPVNCAASPL